MRHMPGMARWVPFVGVGLASLWASAQTTQGYRDPVFDWDLSGPAIANALTKMPHIGSMFMLFVLAALAVGTGRLWLAALLTVAVGIGWEVVQMPTLGNNPRLADLAPDLVGIAIGWAVVALGARLWQGVALRLRTQRTSVRSSKGVTEVLACPGMSRWAGREERR